MTNEQKKEIISWVKVIVFAFVFAYLINTFVIVNANVPTGSMLNTIQEKSRIVAFRWSYLFSDPKRFDIVVFRYPDDETVLYVKRIIGLPGETLEIIDGKVYINGSETPLDDSFVDNPYLDNFHSVTIPEGHYFMMGDNRINSRDSREWNNKFLSEEKILGKVIFSLYPKLNLIK